MAEANGKRRRESDDHVGGETKRRSRRRCYLSEDIQQHILLKLPVKSLVRFRSINQSSSCLIMSEEFAADHLKTFRGEEDYFIKSFLGDEHLLLSNRWWCTAHQGCQNVNLQALHLFYPLEEYQIIIAGCCNGVVCLICSSQEIHDVVLWNPTMGMMATIRTTFDHISPSISSLIFGFGYVNKEYKLVVFLRWQHRGTPSKIDVFCLTTLCWSSHLGCPSKIEWYVHEQRSVFVNGACHWLVEERESGNLVLSFELSKNLLGTIIVPSYLGPLGLNNRFYTVKIFAYDGDLSLIATMTMQQNKFIVWTRERHGEVYFWSRRIETEEVLRFPRKITDKRGNVEEIGETRVLCRLHGFKESLVLINQHMYRTRGFSCHRCGSQDLSVSNRVGRGHR